MFHPSSRNKVVLRVHVVVEYDGPSLSDTASFVESAAGEDAWDEGQYSSQRGYGYGEGESEYSSAAERARLSGHGSRLSFSTEDFSFDAQNDGGGEHAPLDRPRGSSIQWLPRLSTSTLNRSGYDGADSRYNRGSQESYHDRRDEPHGPSGSRHGLSETRRQATDDHPLRQDFRSGKPPYAPQDSQSSLDRSLFSTTASSSGQPVRTATSAQSSLASSELGARWIREQTERARRKLGPASSFGGSSARSSTGGEEGSDDEGTSVYSEGRGNLELVRESNGSRFAQA